VVNQLINRTHFEHAGYGLLFQFVIAAAYALLADLWIAGLWAGGLFSFAAFLFREHAQAQIKYNLNEFQAFDVRRWSWDARIDLLAAAVPCLAVALLATVY